MVYVVYHKEDKIDVDKLLSFSTRQPISFVSYRYFVTDQRFITPTGLPLSYVSVS